MAWIMNSKTKRAKNEKNNNRLSQLANSFARNQVFSSPRCMHQLIDFMSFSSTRTGTVKAHIYYGPSPVHACEMYACNYVIRCAYILCIVSIFVVLQTITWEV